MTEFPYGYITIEKLYEWAKENEIEHFAIVCEKCEHDYEPSWYNITVDEEDSSIML